MMSSSFFHKKTFCHNGSAVFSELCCGCPDVNKSRGTDARILRQHQTFMSIKSFVQHSRWQEMVSLCSLIRLIGLCTDRDQPEFLCSRSDSRNSGVHVAHVRLETRYIDIKNPSLSLIEMVLSIYIDYIDNLRQQYSWWGDLWIQDLWTR